MEHNHENIPGPAGLILSLLAIAVSVVPKVFCDITSNILRLSNEWNPFLQSLLFMGGIITTGYTFIKMIRRRRQEKNEQKIIQKYNENE
jgi:sensor histidine kinase YesM